MVVALTQVPDLPFENGSYDYDAYHEAAAGNYLVPLEVVFRNSVPVGSSLRKRRDSADFDLDFEVGPTSASTSRVRSWSSPRSTRSRTATSHGRKPTTSRAARVSRTSKRLPAR